MRTPSYRLHRPSGRAVVTLSGRDVYLGIHGSPESRDAYSRVVAEWLAGGRHLRPQTGSVVTVAEIVCAYVKAGENRDGRDSRALPIVTRLYGDSLAREFGPLALESARNEMVGRGWTRKSINLCVGRIKTMFRWAQSKQMVMGETLTAMLALPGLRARRSAAPETMPIRPVSDQHVDAALAFLSPPLRAAVEIQRLTGMRSSELLAIRPADVDRAGAGGCWVYRPVQHKGSSRGLSKAVLIGPRGQAILAPWMERPAERLCFRPCDFRPARKGRRAPTEQYTREAFAFAIAKACKKADVPHWHPHQLRHSAGTRIRALAGLDAAQVVLGHRHAQTTEIYAEADIERAAAVMSKVG